MRKKDMTENETICECCCKSLVGELGRTHGYRYCDDCCKCRTCEREGCDGEADEHYLWERAMCDSCEEKEARWKWLDETIEAIGSAAAEHGWSEDHDSQAQTGTRYLTFSRDDETLIIRVADHGSCYCREDYSVVLPGRESGDDHSLAQVLARLAKIVQTEASE
jgi:hypothetical protein